MKELYIFCEGETELAHLQLHEFETLLFADPAALKIACTDIDDAVVELERMVAEAGVIPMTKRPWGRP